DKLVYASGASIEVRFLVTNRGTQPIYIGRNLGPCTGPDGFAALEILDEHGKDMQLSGCSGEGLHHADDELVRWVTGGEAFVLLKPQEIYGSIAQYDVRTKPGKYRLVAELYPAGIITEKQKEMLSQRGIRILQGPVAAPTLTVAVR
ncbi:MAG: hypothetical protein ABSG16_25065, partial [Candidatus Acidiferrum sp.]